MTVTDESVADDAGAVAVPARQAVAELVEAGLLDEVLDRASPGTWR